MSYSLPHLIRHTRGALLLLIVACAAPGRAEARCGHQTSIFKAPIAAPADEPRAAQPEPTSAPGAPAPRPCNGPDCSDRHDRDAPPPAASPTAPRALEATLAPNPSLRPAARPGFARAGYDARPIDRSTSVFHPPRSA
ncbi:MAG: hypothetical protein FJ304_24325 [Planctomycetes bacterium]|nr:hypothetical protein [Planctomycetota bacterium]